MLRKVYTRPAYLGGIYLSATMNLEIQDDATAL